MNYNDDKLMTVKTLKKKMIKILLPSNYCVYKEQTIRYCSNSLKFIFFSLVQFREIIIYFFISLFYSERYNAKERWLNETIFNRFKVEVIVTNTCGESEVIFIIYRLSLYYLLTFNLLFLQI